MYMPRWLRIVGTLLELLLVYVACVPLSIVGAILIAWIGGQRGIYIFGLVALPPFFFGGPLVIELLIFVFSNHTRQLLRRRFARDPSPPISAR